MQGKDYYSPGTETTDSGEHTDRAETYETDNGNLGPGGVDYPSAYRPIISESGGDVQTTTLTSNTTDLDPGQLGS